MVAQSQNGPAQRAADAKVGGDLAGPPVEVAPATQEEFDPEWAHKPEAPPAAVQDGPPPKVDFEHLPAFVKQRRMLTAARLAAVAVVTLALIGLLIYFFVTSKATKDSVEDIIKDPAPARSK
jgi:hypothetical protein